MAVGRSNGSCQLSPLEKRWVRQRTVSRFSLKIFYLLVPSVKTHFNFARASEKFFTSCVKWIMSSWLTYTNGVSSQLTFIVSGGGRGLEVLQGFILMFVFIFLFPKSQLVLKTSLTTNSTVVYFNRSNDLVIRRTHSETDRKYNSKWQGVGYGAQRGCSRQKGSGEQRETRYVRQETVTTGEGDEGRIGDRQYAKVTEVMHTGNRGDAHRQWAMCTGDRGKARGLWGEMQKSDGKSGANLGLNDENCQPCKKQREQKYTNIPENIYAGVKTQ